MAKVIIDSAEVVRRHQNGGGFNAHKKMKLRNGQIRTDKYTVWTTEAVEVGDVVSLQGTLSVKVEEFTNDEGELIRYAAIHVNDPVFAGTGDAQVSDEDAPF